VRLRSVLFWLHLSCGVVAGVVILIMSVTGVLLTYQRQITAWADTRGYRIEPAPQRMSADAIVAKVAEERPDLSPTAVIVRSEPAEPVSLTVGTGRQLFVDPYTGAVLGEGNGQDVRAFFRKVVEWHRYLAMSGDERPLGRAITGAANLMFLFIVVSGMYLWWPRTFTWAAIRNITWFRRGLPARARDFNWHNTIGFWSAIPLAIIVAGGVVISYPWATALVYRAYGEQPPAPAGAARSAASGTATPVAANRGSREVAPAEREHASLETLVARAASQMPDWKTVNVTLASNGATRVVLTVDSGDGGQPHKRATLTLNRMTGSVERWEPFANQSSGRRARTWLRFAHTGEVYGGIGQTVAGVVTGGAVVLVWTGLAMALRRLASWRRRASAALPKAA
jgi:uncharacterized iron-regulated membrane protein